MKKEIEYLKSRNVIIRNPINIAWEKGVEIFKSNISLDDETEKLVKEREKQVSVFPIGDEDFDVYTYSKIRHDGTLIFTREAICEAVKNILWGITFDKRKYEEKELLTKNIEIVYRVGEIILCQYINRSPNFEPWQTSVDEVFIPYKIEIMRAKEEIK